MIEAASERPASWFRALLRSLRPAEAVALGFFALLALYSIVQGTKPVSYGLTQVVLQTPLVVLLVQGLWRYTRTRWPDEIEPTTIWTFRLVSILLLLPVLALVYGLLGLEWSAGDVGESVLAVNFLSVLALVRIFALEAVPFVLIALGLGLHLKTHAGLRPRELFREATHSVGGAVRDWLPPTLMVVAYRLVGGLAQSVNRDADPVLAALDRKIFGVDPVEWLDRVIQWPFSEWFTFAYASYFLFIPLLLGLLYARKDRTAFHELALAYTVSLALGYIGYVLVPARGPGYTITYPQALNNIHTRWIQEALIEPQKIGRDCFPSLHTEFALLFIWASWRHMKWLRWFVAPCAASIPVACVYLRYHYAVDLAGGATLFALVIPLVGWLMRRYPIGSLSASTSSSAATPSTASASASNPVSS
jgi:membrane-associated phospholipid phosphatase